jgi:hypothetical protein
MLRSTNGFLAGVATAQFAGAAWRGLGLNNPRQLSLVHDDVLLIAEAGKGGTIATITSPEGGTQGLGYTGSVSAVLAPDFAHNQHPLRIVTGLLSAANAENGPEGPKGGGATGPDGVSARSLNRIGVVETTFGPNTPNAAKPFDGRLLLTTPFGPIRPFANITAFEQRHDPDRMGVDSNPYAVLAYRGGWLVADAAGNDVLRVDRFGHIRCTSSRTSSPGPARRSSTRRRPSRDATSCRRRSPPTDGATSTSVAYRV